MIECHMTREELLALPLNVDIVTAGRLIGIGRTKSYELARREEFPVELRPVGNGKYRVPRAVLLKYLGVEEAPSSEAPAA